MPARIDDEFTALKNLVSRQRIYQLRHQRDGLCIICAEPAAMRQRCVRHAVAHRELARAYNGCSKRLFGARSYYLEKSIGKATTDRRAA